MNAIAASFSKPAVSSRKARKARHSPHQIRHYLYEPPGPKTRIRIRIATVLSVIVLGAIGGYAIYQFYITNQLAPRYWSFFFKASTWVFLGQGLWSTVKVALMAAAVAFGLGLAMMLGRISGIKVLSAISTALIEFSRGVPTLLFIYFFFLVAPQIGLPLPAFWKITLPVAISAAGVVAEVLRSGVNAVPKGQREAAISLGMRRSNVFFKIIFPQALRYVIPSLIAELVIVLKDTTFASIVSYADLMQRSKVLISNYDALVSVYLVTAVIYVLVNYLLNKLAVAFSARRSDVQIML